ncbi:MAG: S-layer homology domain-containing protein [Oscillospiraceae bacterium]|nr:S-layer homology domain-containing protein [Oscillospiraceae bacterium]
MKSQIAKKLSIILALALAVSVFAAVPAAASDYGSQNSTIGVTGAYAHYDLYSDVTSTDGHWAYEGVMYCTGLGIVNGVGDGQFNPSGTLTRAAFITMIGRAFYEDEVQAQTVDTDNWYSAYVRYLSSAGALSSIPTDDASLGEGMPRQEIAQMLYAVCGGSADEISDDALAGVTDAASISSSCLDAVKYCYSNGYITGYDDGSCKPEISVTRAEAAVVIQRSIDTN